LLEPQRFVPYRHPPQRFLIPVWLQLSVQLSKACGQRGIQDHRHLQPITSLATDDRFQFVEQLLGATDAERRNKHSATVRQGLLQRALKTLPPGAPVLMQPVAIGTLEDDDVGVVRDIRCGQDRRVWRSQIAREYDSSPALLSRVVDVTLNPGRAEDMPGPLKAYAQRQIIPTDNRDPLPIRGTSQHGLDLF